MGKSRDLAEIAAVYVEYAEWWVRVGCPAWNPRQPLGPDHPTEWANDETEEIVSAGGERAWKLLVEISRVAPNEKEILDFIGAGPVENWLRFERFDAVRDDFLKEYEANARLRHMVNAAYWRPPRSIASELAALYARLGVQPRR